MRRIKDTDEISAILVGNKIDLEDQVWCCCVMVVSLCNELVELCGAPRSLKWNEHKQCPKHCAFCALNLEVSEHNYAHIRRTAVRSIRRSVNVRSYPSFIASSEHRGR